MISHGSLLPRLKLELGYFSGRAFWIGRKASGAGVMLRFARVRPRQPGRFQPLKADEITPQFLDRTIRALRRWNYDIVDLDEVCRRSVVMDQPRRFVSLTFDGCYKDLIMSAYPVLADHGVPFAVYVPTAFPDGMGEAWWLALEKIVAQEPRLSLIVKRDERHFTIASVSEKHEVFRFLSSWLRTLPPAGLSEAINDLCRRYSVDLARLSREAAMGWTDLARLAADPNVTIGSATVNHAALANLKEAAALREMTMGKAVAETALHRTIRHFAFPFGDRASFRRADVMMAEQAGFASAATAMPGMVQSEGRTNLFALPRVNWDGRIASLRAMRAALSGIAFAPVEPDRNQAAI